MARASHCTALGLTLRLCAARLMTSPARKGGYEALEIRSVGSGELSSPNFILPMCSSQGGVKPHQVFRLPEQCSSHQLLALGRAWAIATDTCLPRRSLRSELWTQTQLGVNDSTYARCVTV